MKKTTVTIEGQTYIAELVDSLVYDNTGRNQGLLFRVIDDSNEIVGCIKTIVSHSAKMAWQRNEKWSEVIVKNFFLRILPHITFSISKEELKKLYPECLEVFVNYVDPYYDEAKHIQFIKSFDTPEEIVKQIVFGGKSDDDEVVKDILKYLYRMHLENHPAGIFTPDIIEALFIDPGTVYRCLVYLKDDGYINVVDKLKVSGIPGIAFSEITTKGVKYLKSNFQEIHSGTGVVIMGDFVGHDKIETNVNGNGNVTNVNSTVTNSFNIAEVNKKANELKEAIEKEYKGDDKQDLLDQVDEIKVLAPDEKNHSKIRKMLTNIASKGVTVIKIGAAVAELLHLFGAAIGVPVL
jgi:hypothetical protein